MSFQKIILQSDFTNEVSVQDQLFIAELKTNLRSLNGIAQSSKGLEGIRSLPVKMDEAVKDDSEGTKHSSSELELCSSFEKIMNSCEGILDGNDSTLISIAQQRRIWTVLNTGFSK
jgi:hypothetical protein